MDNIIEAHDIDRVFAVASGEPFYALKGVNVEIMPEALTILRGKSGSGKTTLINILGALDMPTKGSVKFNGADLTQQSDAQRELLRRKQIGFVFQSVSLIPMMTVFENVEFALRLAGFKGDRKKRTEECLRLVGLLKRENHMPAELSGGEQQRVSIARAIAHKPKIIFADEPTAELDSLTGLNVIRIFKELVEKEGATIVMTTHDVSLMKAADKVYELEDGQIVC
jgi:putative ABC transport system ATP-binding protein